MRNAKGTTGLKVILMAMAFIGAVSGRTFAQSLHLAAGLDPRFRANDGESTTFALNGAFVNLRKVFSDATGDRVILVTQYDFEDDFTESHFYYAYAQLKGPLGKVNVRLGRYILPFGLLYYYDTERLLLHALDPVSLGIKTDVGAEVFGIIRGFDYALSVSNGAGRRWRDENGNKLVTGRIGYNWDDTRFGFSYLNGLIDSAAGEIPYEARYRERLAADFESYSGASIMRAELIYGRDGDQTVAAAYLGVDHALSPNLEVNLKYSVWYGDSTTQLPGLGVSYKLLDGVFLRLADAIQIENGEVTDHEFQVQFYAEFLQHL